MPRTPEQMAEIRAWRAYLMDYPLHDGHVRAFASITKGIQWKRFDCPACSKEVWPLERKRDSVGRLLKYCGCRTRTVDKCGMCRGDFVVEEVNQKYCAECQPKAARASRTKAKQIARRKKGIPPRLHDGHVRAFGAANIVAAKRLHDAHVKHWRSDGARIARWRNRYDPRYLLNARMRVAIRKALKGGKAGRSWEGIVGYTVDDLRRHIERQMPKGYTLDDMFGGRIHLDHIVPKSTFNVEDPKELRSCWSLANLRPLPAVENMRKGAKLLSLL